MSRVMADLVRGRTVAVVGPAGSLVGSGSGPKVDACEVVIRVNSSLPPAGHPEDVGARTDAIYHALRRADLTREIVKGTGVLAIPVAARVRKRLAIRAGQDSEVYRPTTGVVAIFEALLCGAEVWSYGIDCYRSGYIEGDYPVPGTPEYLAGRSHLVCTWDHNPEIDLLLLRQLVRTEPRFRPDAGLREALYEVAA